MILSNEEGEEQGTEDLLKAHEGVGKLHKAFSVFVFRNNGNELLMQKRSAAKPLFPLLWANTCCSHPQEGEDIIAAAQKRLREEMGFTCNLKIDDSFVYQAKDEPNNLSEHEFDTILVGETDDVDVNPNPNEVDDYRWITLEDLQNELDEKPEEFAPWFPIALSKLYNK